MIKTSINTKNNLGDGVLLLSKELFFVLFVLAIVLIFHPARTDAATFDVAAGSSTVNDGDSICQLEEAGTNINDGARTYADCEETGTYGSNDTIQLPAGTINLSGSGLELRNSAKIIGNGKGISIIDGGDYQGGIRFYGSGSGIGSGLTLPDFVIRNFTLSNLGSGIALGGGGIGQLTVEGLEIKNAAAGIFLGGFEEISVTDSYLHDINYVGSGIPPTGIIALSSFDQQFSGKTVNVNIENTTISDTSVGVILYAVGSEGSGSGSDAEIYTGTVDATIQNTTFANLHSTGNEPDPISAAAGISTFVGGATITYNTINNTYSNISSPAASNYKGVAVSEGILSGSGLALDSRSHISHTAQNDLYATGGEGHSVNYARWAMAGSGEFEQNPNSNLFTTTSKGGNLSSDGSLSKWLNQSTDQHNVTSLASFLGVLSDNGGPVPTLALKQGSPAVDAGTPVSGMKTDARGALRPQGNGFDVGAYESAFSRETLAGTGEDSRQFIVNALVLTLLSSGSIWLARRLAKSKYQLH